MVAVPQRRTDIGDRFVTDPGTLEGVRQNALAFIRETVENADAEGVVVAMSGGIDSTLTAALAVEALGADRVFGLLLPCNMSSEAGTNDARTMAEGFGIDYEEIHLRPLFRAFEETVADGERSERQALGNVIPRLRMACSYYAANLGDRLVVGTGNRTELLLGYFTKYGDGGVDFLPLGNLYKTEVRALARHVGIPRRIVEKPSTAGLWAGQTDERELGAPYDTIDAVLRRLVDDDLGIERTAVETGTDLALVRRFARMHLDSRHKRATAPTPADERRDDEHFHELELRVSDPER